MNTVLIKRALFIALIIFLPVFLCISINFSFAQITPPLSMPKAPIDPGPKGNLANAFGPSSSALPTSVGGVVQFASLDTVMLPCEESLDDGAGNKASLRKCATVKDRSITLLHYESRKFIEKMYYPYKKMNTFDPTYPTVNKSPLPWSRWFSVWVGGNNITDPGVPTCIRHNGIKIRDQTKIPDIGVDESGNVHESIEVIKEQLDNLITLTDEGKYSEKNSEYTVKTYTTTPDADDWFHLKSDYTVGKNHLGEKCGRYTHLKCRTDPDFGLGNNIKNLFSFEVEDEDGNKSLSWNAFSAQSWVNSIQGPDLGIQIIEDHYSGESYDNPAGVNDTDATYEDAVTKGLLAKVSDFEYGCIKKEIETNTFKITHPLCLAIAEDYKGTAEDLGNMEKSLQEGFLDGYDSEIDHETLSLDTEYEKCLLDEEKDEDDDRPAYQAVCLAAAARMATETVFNQIIKCELLSRAVSRHLYEVIDFTQSNASTIAQNQCEAAAKDQGFLEGLGKEILTGLTDISNVGNANHNAFCLAILKQADKCLRDKVDLNISNLYNKFDSGSQCD